jgi:hypothetical protein
MDRVGVRIRPFRDGKGLGLYPGAQDVVIRSGIRRVQTR